MKFNRVIPKARDGTSGLEIDVDIAANERIWTYIPSRIATTTVRVNIPKNETAQFTIEISFNSVDKIGDNGTGGYWQDALETIHSYSEETDITLVNNISAIRISCLSADSTINVCIRG